MLKAQGGCRGFGQLATAVLVITSDLHAFSDTQERNQCYLNAGFFAMTVLYALHEEHIGACVLNWSNTTKKDQQLRHLLPEIRPSEEICCLISCGYPPQEFDVALSLRKNSRDCISFVDDCDHEDETVSKSEQDCV